TGEVAKMKTFKAVGVGLMVFGLLFAVPLAAIAINLTVGQHDTTNSVAMPHMSSSGMGGMSMSGTQTSAAAEQLTIIHVQKGCHVWSNGTSQMATVRLTMKPGQMLRIMNQDVDMHRMIELSGPDMMALGGPMSQGQVDTLTFARPGVYRFGTKV